MSAPVLEFADGSQAPFALSLAEVVIGSHPSCTLRLAAGGVSGQHARLFTDEAGVTWLEDLGSRGGTLLNGRRVDAWEQVNEGDRIEVGVATLFFRATASAPPPVTEARTMMESEAPPVVRELLAKQKAAAQAKASQPGGTGQTVAARPRAGTVMGMGGMAPVRPHPAAMQQSGGATQQAAPAPQHDHIALQHAPTMMEGPPSHAAPSWASLSAPAADSLMPLPPAAPSVEPLPAPPVAASQQGAPAWTDPAFETVQHYFDPMPPGVQWGASPLPAPAVAPSPPAAPSPPVAQPWGASAAVPFGEPPQPGWGGDPYVPPARKGPLGSIGRALDFYAQMFALAKRHRVLLTPLAWDLAITTALSIVLCGIDLLVRSAGATWALLSVGTLALYFIDYACNSLTASLIYEQVTTGRASAAAALPRVRRALPGILMFAAVSAPLDVASTWARERRDAVARILLDVLRRVWSTATYVIMPALVLEGVSFGAALKRSKDLMAQDPTGVGAGVVALSLTSYLVGAVAFFLAWTSFRLFSHVHPALGLFFFFTFVNAFWAVSGWLKIAYSTLFYMWAAECERNRSADAALAPSPLRHALDAA